MLALESDAEETASGLLGVVDEAASAADEEAARVALDLVGPRTPRRTGLLAAGLRSVAVAGGFELTAAEPYASYVDAATGFASETLLAAESTIEAIYERHTQDRLDDVGP